jgi:hypothetical protein
MNFPKLVTRFLFLAIYPSKKSVKEAMQKTAQAIQRKRSSFSAGKSIKNT